MNSGHSLEVELTGQVDAAEKAGVRNQCDSLASVPVWLVIPFQKRREESTRLKEEGNVQFKKGGKRTVSALTSRRFDSLESGETPEHLEAARNLRC